MGPLGYVLVIVGIIILTAVLAYVSVSAYKNDWTEWPQTLFAGSTEESKTCKLACDPVRQVLDSLACKCSCKDGFHLEGESPNLRCEPNESVDLPTSVPMIQPPSPLSSPSNVDDNDQLYYGGPEQPSVIQPVPGDIFGDNISDFPCVPKCQYGTCVNQRCVCQPGYNGVGCEGPITEYWCPGHKCNNSIDAVNPSSCKCICPMGVSGEYCTMIDEANQQACNNELYRKYPGLNGVWGGDRCLQTRQNCPIDGNKTLICRQNGSQWFVQDAMSSTTTQCFIGDEYDGFSIGDIGRVGDRCLRGNSKTECENIINKINCY